MERQPPSPSREAKTRAHALSKKYPTERTEPVRLPPHHWINLTNGVEMLPTLSQNVERQDIRFTRLQSSHCEASAYDKLLWSIDNDMLLSLAIGRPCYIYDLASRNKLRGVSRALFLGLQFAKWSLAYLWYADDRPQLVPERVMVRGKNVVPFWRDDVMPYRIGKDTKKRMRYFLPYVREMGTSEIRLVGVYGASSDIDGCMALHVKHVRQWVESLSVAKIDEPGGDWLAVNGYSVYNSNASCDELRDIQERMRSQNDMGTSQVPRA